MIDSYEVADALFEQISSDAKVLEGGYRITHSDYINHDPGLAPWVGVYMGRMNYAPGSLGRHSQSWEATIDINILIQASHGGDSAECSKRLAEYEKVVLDAIWADPTLGGAVDMIVGMGTTYLYNNEESETMFFQQAAIVITVEASAG